MEIPIYVFCMFFVACLRLAQACSGHESSRTCECSAMYTAGEYDLVDSMGVSIVDEAKIKRLFGVEEYNDCGLNLGCDTTKQEQCAEYCAKKVIEKLSASSVINQVARESLCRLVMKNEPLFENGIRLFAHWRYSSCASGYKVLEKNLCCNQVCDCELLRHGVKTKSELVFYKESNRTDAFKCDKVQDDPCVSWCRTRMALKVGDAELDTTSSSSLDLFSNQTTSNKVCSLMNEVVPSPGVDVMVRVKTNRYKYVNDIHLGRLCCRSLSSQVCNCDLTVKAVNNPGLNHQVNSYLFTATDAGYQCNDELNYCMQRCRNQILLSTMNSTMLTSELNVVDKRRDIAVRTCEFIMKSSVNLGTNATIVALILKDGIDAYMEFNRNKTFPQNERLFLGRFCCAALNSTTLVPATSCPIV